jgi:hypothetical protein
MLPAAPVWRTANTFYHRAVMCAFSHAARAAAHLVCRHRDRSTPIGRAAEILIPPQRRLTMKTIMTLLTTTMLVAGATSAMAADRQATDDAAGYAISQQASHGFGGAYASARDAVRGSSVVTQNRDDMQLVGR